MKNIFDTVAELLLTNNKYKAEDGKLLKAVVYNDVMAMSDDLLTLLLSNERVKETFFKNVQGTLVFDKQKFAWFMESKEFLPDSYTAYTNKIGLTNNGNFISQTNDVVLDFPYKDCVLEGGQDKDDQKRSEIFYNETIASDEISRMLAPKVFTNAKRYTAVGEKDLTGELDPNTIHVEEETGITLKDDDNLIIKGNNLIALASLLKRYEGKVKCIYIDPPYNTGNDSFNYNDSFNHSTWLTFMKNRLELAKKLLREDGVILVSIDEKQQAYLKVLMDEIFGDENLLEVFHIQVRYTNKSLNEKDDFQPVMEYVLAYAFNKKIFKPNKPYKAYNLNKFEWQINELAKGEEIEIGGKKVTIFKVGEYEIKKIKPNLNGLKETWASGSVLTGNTSGKFFDQYISKRKNTDGLKVLYKVNGIGDDGIGYRYFTGPQKEQSIRGKFYSGVPLDKREALEHGESIKYYPIVNYYDYSPDFGNIRHEGGVAFNAGKKPELMLKMLFDFSTNEGDLILDFHIGSGSSCAVAHKMNRRYIGIEQMDYIEEKSVNRLKSVICGDTTGISQEINWHGGGSFVYCELKEDANMLITTIQNAAEDTIESVKAAIYADERIVPYLTKQELADVDKDFENLTLEEKKQALIKLVDKNKLYVNASDMDDTAYEISDADKAFTKSFYEEA